MPFAHASPAAVVSQSSGDVISYLLCSRQFLNLFLWEHQSYSQMPRKNPVYYTTQYHKSYISQHDKFLFLLLYTAIHFKQLFASWALWKITTY